MRPASTDTRPAIDHYRQYKITLWFIVFATLPFVAVVNVKGAYFIFGAVYLMSVFCPAPRYPTPFIRISVPVLIQFVILLFLFPLYLHQPGTVLNIGALVFVAIMTLWLVSVPWDEEFRVWFFRRLVITCYCVIVAAAAASVVLSSIGAEIENPIRDFMVGERIRLLAWKTGHSILIDLAFINLIIATSDVARLGKLSRLLIVMTSIVFFYLAKTSTGYYIAGVSFIVFLAEWTMPPLIRLALYLTIVFVFGWFFLDPELFANMMFFVRSNLQGMDMSVYANANGDLTAGRAALNRALLSLIQSSPFIGVGHENPVLQHGVHYFVTEKPGTQLATVESGLRLAAKYGLPYFASVIAFVLLPLVYAFRSEDPAIRIFNTSLSLCILSLTATITQFEVPHFAPTFIYFSLLAIASSFRGSEASLSEGSRAGALASRIRRLRGVGSRPAAAHTAVPGGRGSR